MKHMLLLILVAVSTQLPAESAIPAGTILPVELKSSLNSKKSKAGQPITGRIRQDVPLPGGSTIHSGAKVIGHVVGVGPASKTSGALLVMRFDTVIVSKRRIPVTTSLRVLASSMAVWGAQLPKTGPDYGTPKNAWNTVQVGGDEVVYRGGGPVVNGKQIVGRPTNDSGVLARVASKPGSMCRGQLQGDDRLQAFWVFSSDACGTYDLPHVTIIHAGRSEPMGEIVLASDKDELNVRAGSGMLLRVNSTAGK